jgi:hypothetical protein
VISTGEYVDQYVRVNDCGLEEPPLDPRILFDANSTSPISRSFSVAPGECALLTAYATCACTICVEKLLYSRPTLPLQAGGSCACDLPAAAPELLASTMICGWCLGACSEIKHICVPGIYRLVMGAGCLGCVTVTFERVPMRDTPIPEKTVFGAA